MDEEEFTPATADVEAAYVMWRTRNTGRYHLTVHEDGNTTGPLEEFRRWLVEERREALHEGAWAGRKGYI